MKIGSSTSKLWGIGLNPIQVTKLKAASSAAFLLIFTLYLLAVIQKRELKRELLPGEGPKLLKIELP